MLQTYTGTPGSGKSYHIVDDMISHLKIGGVVVTNLELDLKNILKYHPKLTQKDLDERLIILPNECITPKLLYNLSFQHKNNPYARLLVIDEAGDLFNTREWNNSNRPAWLKFFRMHRHLRYNCILVSQHRKMLDKQIQWLFDVDVQHRNIKEFGFFGWFLHLIFPKLFVAVSVYVPLNAKSNSQAVWLKKKYYSCYDTYTLDNIPNGTFD